MSDDKEKNNNENQSNAGDFEFPSLHDDVTSPKESTEPVSSKPAEEDLADLAKDLDRQSGPSEPSRLLVFLSRHRMPVLIGGTLLLALGIWGIRAMRSSNSESSTPVVNSSVDQIPVNVAEVRMGRFQDAIEVVGDIKGESEIELRFETEGIIAEMNIFDGQRVKKGTLLARLNDQDAVLRRKKAQVECEQMRKLEKLGGVSPVKVQEACLNLEVAMSELRRTRLTAPIDGIIGDKGAEVGEFVTPQRKVATLVSIKNVIVKVGVTEKQLNDEVRPGKKIQVTTSGLKDEIFEGEIASVSPIIIGESRTAEVTAKISNPNYQLLPGMFAQAKIITYEMDDAIFIPNEAIVKKSDRGFEVYVVGEDNIVEARDVEPGIMASELTQIDAGLSPGEVIVVQKPPELKAGSKVKIIDIQK